MSWTSAQTFCRTFYTDLTSVRNPVEAGIIQEIIGYTEVWIGLFRDPWVWSDQGDSSLRLWSADQMVWSDDSSECAAMLKNESGRWGGRNCTERHPFFCSCKYPESKQTYVKVRLNLSPSALNLNHPNVQKTLLKQMELKLIEDGLDVMQTTWLKQPDGKIFVKETP
ncbi:C-type lectin BfL-2-like [Kryptolebias marmoratus]|uniref:C-type lectin BfL-2-like n=1 Tax=Kryptolebias marmoratus TaxID=37003 RepID=UPI0018ACA308|nr:C-type lectin BfL-2-like [Kryptolebias marmoratus]